MLEITKRKLFTHKDVWFPDDLSYPPKKCDVCCLIGVPELHQDNVKSVQYDSLLSHVDTEREQLDASFTKVTKYDIRRSANDNLSIVHYTSDALECNETVYEQFAEVYNEMYKMKGLHTLADIKSIRRISKVGGGVLISCASCEDVPTAFHVYVIDGINARLWMSTSVFRESEDKQFRAKVGRANKRLHYEDMLYFHDNGYKTYDWGGISSFIEPNGIDQFKMSFGGTPIVYYDETFICSKRYKLFYRVKKLLKGKR